MAQIKGELKRGKGEGRWKGEESGDGEEGK